MYLFGYLIPHRVKLISLTRHSGSEVNEGLKFDYNQAHWAPIGKPRFRIMKTLVFGGA